MNGKIVPIKSFLPAIYINSKNRIKGLNYQFFFYCYQKIKKKKIIIHPSYNLPLKTLYSP